MKKENAGADREHDNETSNRASANCLEATAIQTAIAVQGRKPVTRQIIGQ